MEMFGHIFLWPFILSLCETVKFRLKYCLKEPIKPKQPLNPSNLQVFIVVFPCKFFFYYLSMHNKTESLNEIVSVQVRHH